MTKKCCLLKIPMYGTEYNNQPYLAGMMNEISTSINMLRNAYMAEEKGLEENAERFFIGVEVLIRMTHNRWECNRGKLTKMVMKTGKKPVIPTFKSTYTGILDQWIKLGNIPKKDKGKYQVKCNSKEVISIGV